MKISSAVQKQALKKKKTTNRNNDMSETLHSKLEYVLYSKHQGPNGKNITTLLMETFLKFKKKQKQKPRHVTKHESRRPGVIQKRAGLKWRGPVNVKELNCRSLQIYMTIGSLCIFFIRGCEKNFWQKKGPAKVLLMCDSAGGGT